MSGLTYSPPPPSFSFTLLWDFDDGIQLGKLVMLLGLENVDVKSLVLPLTIPSDEDGTGSLWKLLSWRTSLPTCRTAVGTLSLSRKRCLHRWGATVQTLLEIVLPYDVPIGRPSNGVHQAHPIDAVVGVRIET